MAIVTSYDIVVTRDGKWWSVRIPELGVVTQARRLADVRQAAREAIAVTLDLPIEEVQVELRGIRSGDIDVSERVQQMSAERAQAAALDRHASQEAVALAAALNADGVPLRDIGEALGVSFQRAQQLVAAASR